MKETGLRRLMHNGLALSLSNVLGAMLGFAISLVIARSLGVPGLGQWTFCLAWVSVLTMISEFGLNTWLTREAAGSRQGANQLLVATLAAKLAFCGLLGGALLIASPILGPDPETASALRAAAVLLGTGVAYGSFTALLRAFEQMRLILWLNVGGLLLQLIWSVSSLKAGYGVPALVAIAAAVQTVQLVAAAGIWSVRWASRAGRLRPTWPLMRTMLRRTWPFAAASLVGALQMRSGPLLLGYLRDQADVGWFGAASRLSEAAKLIPNGLFAAAFPAFAATASAGRTDLLWKSLGRILVPLTLMLTLGLSLGARPALWLAYGTPFLPAETTLIWLSLGLVPNLLNGGMEVYLYAVGDEVYALKLGVIAVGIQIVTSLPLITGFGASGAAVAMLLGELAIWWPLRCRVRQRTERPVEAQAATG